jgi:hypothetical protein
VQSHSENTKIQPTPKPSYKTLQSKITFKLRRTLTAARRRRNNNTNTRRNLAAAATRRTTTEIQAPK